MSLNTRGMIVETRSGSDTRQQSTKNSESATRVTACDSSSRQNLRDATLRMGRALKRVPREVANRWYGFTRSECRYSNGHLMGAWPEVARAFAVAGAPLQDVMACADQVKLELRRDVYSLPLPSLAEVEEREAEIALRIQKAEIEGDTSKLKDAAREEIYVAEQLEEVAERETFKGRQVR